MSKPHARGVDLTLGRKVAKQIANQNCYWPVTQVMADKLLVSPKRLIRYIALYSMAGVAMETRLFRIHPSSRDTTFMEACAAYLTPKMSLSQVMPSGCHLRRVALPPANQPALADRPSASDYPEEQLTITPDEMCAAVTTPVFQPYRGATGRAWLANEYGVTMDNSSLMSSETERDDTDDEIVSFDLGPEPYEPDDHTRLPSDEWLDDLQQGLHPGSSEPRYDPYDRYKPMPNQTYIMDMMRSDMETNELDKAPPPRARAPAQTVRWDFDFVRDENHPLSDVCKRAQWKLQHRAQSPERRTYALNRLWNFRAQEPPRRPQLRTQPNVWLFSIPQLKRRSPLLLRHRVHRTLLQNRTPKWFLKLLHLLLNPEGAEGEELGAHHRQRLQLQEWGRVARRVSESCNSKKRRKHRLLRPGGHPLQICQRTL